MNYTDEEILDLEEALETVGHSKHTRFALVEPDEWSQKEMGVFGRILLANHGEEFQNQGITLGTSHMLIPTLERKGRSVLTVEGPSIKASRALDFLYEKYSCQLALEFGD
jgi:hypothetical protein